MNFARLNHILIPSTLEGRERLRQKRYIKLLRPFGWAYGALSDEGRIMSLLVLFVGTASLEVGRTQVYMLWVVLVGLMVAAVTLRRAYALKNVSLEVHAPDRLSVGAEMTFQLTMRSTHDAPHHAIRVRGPFLPWDGAWRGELGRASELAAHGQWTSEARARFIERGPHHIEPFTACAVLPFGLSVGPSVSSRGCRFTVVPRIAPVTKLDLRHGDSHERGGARQMLSRGDATEILGVRPYRRGDSLRDLHPKTWARTGIPHVREYQHETFTRVGIIVDTDAEGSTERGFEGVLSLTAGVIAKLAHGDTMLATLVLGRQRTTFGSGSTHAALDRALDELAHAKVGTPLVIDELLDELASALQMVSSVVVITQSTDASRLALVSALQERRIAVRLLRVHDDGGWQWLARRRPFVPARADVERVVRVTEIDGEEPISL